MTHNIQCTLTERRWMRAAKAWRCFLSLPNDTILASALTALIDKKTIIDISTKDATLTINPAFIVDIQGKGKRFTLVAETVYEQQATHGAILTAMTGENVSVTIRPVTEAEQPVFAEKKRGTITPETIKGLHVAFFKNIKFYEFLSGKTGIDVSPAECKAIFKRYMGVASCTEIDQSDFDAILKEFNEWLNL